MIRSKKELKFYLKADEIMNEQVFPQSLIKRLLMPNPIQTFLRNLRKLEYYSYKRSRNRLYTAIWVYYKIKHHKSSIQLGFDIPINTIGYGCRIAHQCGIIINGNTRIGNYCCLYRASFADALPKKIGNNVFIGTNVVIAKNIEVADGTTISAMSFLNKSILNNNELWGGVVASKIKESRPWTEEYPYCENVRRCELLRKSMGLTDI